MAGLHRAVGSLQAVKLAALCIHGALHVGAGGGHQVPVGKLLERHAAVTGGQDLLVLLLQARPIHAQVVLPQLLLRVGGLLPCLVEHGGLLAVEGHVLRPDVLRLRRGSSARQRGKGEQDVEDLAGTAGQVGTEGGVGHDDLRVVDER